MASAITALANLTLSTNPSTVSFSSINSGYRDLFIVADFKSSSGDWVKIRLNSDSGYNYDYVLMANENGTNASYSNYGFDSALINIVAGTSSAQQLLVTNILDYSAAKHKIVITRNNAAFSGSTSGVALHLNRWPNTSTVTSVSFTMASGTFSSGSIFTLYGVSS